MTTTSMRRMVLPFTALVAAGGVALFFASRTTHDEPPVDTRTAFALPQISEPASPAPDKGPLAAAQEGAKELAGALSGLSPPPVSDDGGPSFDVARIEPTGEAVIAGRATPGATVELLRNGEVHDRTVADQSGQFAFVPRPLPPGTYDLTLRSRQPDGKETTSKQNVAVSLEPSKDRTIAALITPGKPTVVLSQPPAPGTESVVVEAVETESGGKLHVSGRARPGAAVRLYLNDSLVASATADSSGRVSVTINKDVASGNHRVRLDEVSSDSSTVRARAEVPFSVPDTAITSSVQAQAKASGRPDSEAKQQRKLAAATGTVQPDRGSPPDAAALKTGSMTVSRGDSLWSISQRALGAGQRYAVIYQANKKQIRNPNLIYPGQVFVVPER